MNTEPLNNSNQLRDNIRNYFTELEATSQLTESTRSIQHDIEDILNNQASYESQTNQPTTSTDSPTHNVDTARTLAPTPSMAILPPEIRKRIIEKFITLDEENSTIRELRNHPLTTRLKEYEQMSDAKLIMKTTKPDWDWDGIFQ